MKKLVITAMSLAVLTSSSAFAQNKTRVEVYQELVEAQQNGLTYVTDASYPDVNPIFAAQAARMQREHLAQQRAAITDSTTN
ncbi:DUF4148 domain-containing protein [Paraburkholderia sp. RP-4-7]|uniref:DUF4148 domain-containing protein n=1 Tax=Paraburkholderia polaris TaxID=2728848 RepID=A0A848IC01_9BURK|nr:DUF4148 domain-containing protein [Paraburkholderia polaris]NML97604.1 DUF4148 domain-containing protein [Paraburkholderia polaris]